MQASSSRAPSLEANPRPQKHARHHPAEPESAPAPAPAPANVPAQDEFVRLNVGGEHYDVARTVLDQPRAGMLRQLVARDSTSRVDGDNRICLDADGKLFRYSLYHLRHNRHPEGLPPHKRDMLQVEAEFLGLQQLSGSLLLEKVSKELESSPHSVSARLRLADTLYDVGDEQQAWQKLESAYELLPDGDAYEQYETHYAAQLADKPNCPWRLLRAGSAVSLAARADQFTSGSELSLCLKGRVLLHRSKWSEALSAANAALSQRENSVDALLLRGRALVGLRRHSEALYTLDGVLSLRPYEAEVHLGRATVSLRNQQQQQADIQIQRALYLRPHHPEAHAVRGEYFRRNGQRDAAINSFDEALRLDPSFVSANVGRGRTFIMTKEWQEALDAFDEALKLSPNYSRAHFFRGAALRSLGKDSEALAAIERSLEIAPNYAEAHLFKSQCLSSLGRAEDALVAALRSVELSPNCPVSLTNLALVQAKLGQNHEALRHFDLALQIMPNSRQAILGQACLLDDMNDARALPALTAALQVAPPNAFTPMLLRLGRALTRAGSAHGAVDMFSRILQQHPNSVEAYRGRAHALGTLGRLAEACNDYNQAVLLAPRDAPTQVSRGDLLLQMHDFNAAWAAYDFALGLTPSASAHFGRAEACRARGQFSAALTDYDSALRLQPDHADAQRGRDEVLRHLPG